MKTTKPKVVLTYILLLTIVPLLFVACDSNPISPIVIKDPTRFTWTVDTIANAQNFQSIMNSIFGSSPEDVYVCGSGSANVAQMYHYDGHRWAVVPLTQAEGGPFGASIGLNSGVELQPNDIWIVGSTLYLDQQTWRIIDSTLIIHFDGATWKMEQVHGADLASLDGKGPGDMWASGYSGSIIHFDGTQWQPSVAPVPHQGMEFLSIAEVAPNDVYTVGFIYDVTSPRDTGSYFLFHFDGSAWKVLDSAIITSAYVGSIRFGQRLFSVDGKLFSAWGNGAYVFSNGSWLPLVEDGKVMFVGGNGAKNLFALGAYATAYWSNGTTWTHLNLPASTDITFSGVWTNGVETFIMGNDGYKTYIYHGK